MKHLVLVSSLTQVSGKIIGQDNVNVMYPYLFSFLYTLWLMAKMLFNFATVSALCIYYHTANKS